MPRLTVLLLLGLASTARAAHPVFDLLANRTLAHAERDGALAIAAGGPGFARYVHFSRPIVTWKLRLVEDGKRVALAQAQAVLEVPLSDAQAASATVRLRLKSPVKQTVRIAANGKSSTPVALAPGWQTASVTLPAGALVAGENKLLFTFAESGRFGDKKASAAVEWIEIGPASAAAPERPAPAIADGHGLLLPRGGGLVYYVQIPAGGALTARVDGDGCTVKVRAQARGAKAIEGTLTSGAPFDLAPLAGEVARLALSADGCAAAHLGAAALTASSEAPAPRAEIKRPRNIVFWMTDDTRSDKYRLYNPKTRVETPILDAFAKRATLFKVAYVQGNESRVSHASIWTALYPAQHHFIAEKAKLDPKFVTLAEAIKPSGVYTAGFMANGFIDAFWGFAEGWDLLRNFIHEGGGLKAEDLVQAAKGFLTQRGKEPFFLYLGTIDAHVSWRAHQPWLGKYDPEPYAGPFVKACLDPQLDQIVAGKLHVTERDKTRIIALYDSDVSYNDQQLGRLLQLLDANGHADDTMIIFTADHGEELWDHGRIGHGQSLREELVHVPLLIAYPPLFPAGKVVEEGVESVDLLPTIVDVLGGKPVADAQGESLLPLVAGRGQGYPRPAIASQYELAHTMRLGRWKLWVGGSGEVRLFDAANDAAEARELSSARPYERRFVTDALGLWMAYQSQWKKTRWGVASNHKPELAADLER